MDDVRPSQSEPPEAAQTAGDMLKSARLAKGMTLADVGAATRVPLRHLAAIEIGDYAALPSATYAVGFAKAYARAVGVDEVAIAQRVRGDVDRLGPRTSDYQPYDIVDPARIPSRGVAIVALGVALALLILVGLWFGTDLFTRRSADEGSAPVVSAPAPVVRPAPAVPRADAAAGQVELTATGDVWLRVYDAANKTLYLGTMKQGDRFAVPRDANDPMINVGRPDLLAITLNGAAIPPLGTGERPIKDVRVDAAAIAARAGGQVAAPGPVPTSTPAAVAQSTGPRRAERPVARHGDRATRPRLTETQRANLASAANPPPPAASQTPR